MHLGSLCHGCHVVDTVFNPPYFYVPYITKVWCSLNSLKWPKCQFLILVIWRFSLKCLNHQVKTLAKFSRYTLCIYLVTMDVHGHVAYFCLALDVKKLTEWYLCILYVSIGFFVVNCFAIECSCWGVFSSDTNTYADGRYRFMLHLDVWCGVAQVTDPPLSYAGF